MGWYNDSSYPLRIHAERQGLHSEYPVYLPLFDGPVPDFYTSSAITALFRQRRSRSVLRHQRYRDSASRVLLRLPQLSADGQRLLYLRKVNPMSLKR
jgi:hypothetical protein